ncbi:hypothetical protein BOTBODRAFT_581789 [Botryobasidium botryosum FD-172 SS1]|uniref:Uncharacterized protein n=1 Tax=Botryobasidium botryosum (strain FD-172 SS1) TaxID=930990 RepID=A0A067MSQ2_BOTB1|nr:hypothetical protein BOTBODRAFT_581789 [Botryobasidium botryosum FD-172 SS1]
MKEEMLRARSKRLTQTLCRAARLREKVRQEPEVHAKKVAARQILPVQVSVMPGGHGGGCGGVDGGGGLRVSKPATRNKQSRFLRMPSA